MIEVITLFLPEEYFTVFDHTQVSCVYTVSLSDWKFTISVSLRGTKEDCLVKLRETFLYQTSHNLQKTRNSSLEDLMLLQLDVTL